jgi:hypothetical protein
MVEMMAERSAVSMAAMKAVQMEFYSVGQWADYLAVELAGLKVVLLESRSAAG